MKWGQQQKSNLEQKQQKIAGKEGAAEPVSTIDIAFRKNEARKKIAFMIETLEPLTRYPVEYEAPLLQRIFALIDAYEDYKNYAKQSEYVLRLPQLPPLSPLVQDYREINDKKRYFPAAIELFPIVKKGLEEIAKELGDSEAGPGVTIADSEFILNCL